MKQAGVVCYPPNPPLSASLRKLNPSDVCEKKEELRDPLEEGNGSSGHRADPPEDCPSSKLNESRQTAQGQRNRPPEGQSAWTTKENPSPVTRNTAEEDFESPKITSPRARAREAAFQILFHWDINPQFPLGEVDRFLRETLPNPAAVEFAQELIRGVTELRDRLDEAIQSVAEHWAISRMSVTDRNVLRMGTYELLYTDTPGEVIIDQAVELAKRFGTSQSGAFVNGILDQLMRKIRRPDPQAS
jgi:N utilization substance protein B